MTNTARCARAAAAAVCCVVVLGAQDVSFRYPAARKADTRDTYFGTAVADPYRWMEDLNSPELKQWIDAQNAVTAAYLDALPVRDALKSRITELYNYPRVSIPAYTGRHWFFARNTGLQRQSIIVARREIHGPEQMVIDPNEMSPDGSVALSEFAPAPDDKHLVYGQSEGGSDWVTYFVRGLDAGSKPQDEIRWAKFSHVAWTEDGRGFFYERYPEPPAGKSLEAALRDHKVYYHALGTAQSADRLVYERPDDPGLFLFAACDETGRYLWIITNKGTSPSNQLFVKDLGDPRSPHLDAAVRPLYPVADAQYDPLGVVDGVLYLRTDRNAPNRKIVAVPLDRPDVANWKTIVPETSNAIESATLIAGMIAVNRLVDVASVVDLFHLDGSHAATILTPELGAVTGPVGRFDRPEIWYSFTSPLRPATVFHFDARTGVSTPFEPPHLTFDPAPYMTERVFATSADGTRVPVFLTHRRDLKKDGANPAMLYGYGGFAVVTAPLYRSDIPAWLERGGVWATASMRGGSEYGETWHRGGMFEHKQRVFDDFIAAAEYLVENGYASPRTLGIMGGSNGGLLVGAVMEQRPDLFAVALPAVGVMDMLRYQTFTVGAAWATEYGASDDPTAFAYLYRYSPLHNLKPGTCYPATLATTADHDDRVVPSHSFKFIAALQEAQGCARPVMIRVETEASHGYRPTDKRIAELADQWAFTLANMNAAAAATKNTKTY
jgi:prolyl oligopeptidase